MRRPVGSLVDTLSTRGGRRSWKFEFGSSELVVGILKREVGSSKLEVGSEEETEGHRRLKGCAPRGSRRQGVRHSPESRDRGDSHEEAQECTRCSLRFLPARLKAGPNGVALRKDSSARRWKRPAAVRASAQSAAPALRSSGVLSVTGHAISQTRPNKPHADEVRQVARFRCAE